MITDKLILEGKKCPYCGKEPEYVDSTVIYGRSYGMIYLCRPCDAYVGVHDGSSKAKGRLANKELRKVKIEAHKYFDMIWKQGHLKRTDAYKWLSTRLGIPSEHTHIGMFDVETCEMVVFSAKQLLNDLRRLDLDMGVEPKTEFFEI